MVEQKYGKIVFVILHCEFKGSHSHGSAYIDRAPHPYQHFHEGYTTRRRREVSVTGDNAAVHHGNEEWRALGLTGIAPSEDRK